jgi:hypothetical protein
MSIRTAAFAVIPLVVMASAPASGQQQDAQSQNQEGQAQQDQGPQEQQDQKAQQQASRSSQERQARQSGSSAESRQARRHYMAGFVRGYYCGFADGLDDYLIIVGSQGKGDQSRQRASSQSRQRQAYEANARQRLRENARNRASQQRGPRQPADQSAGARQQFTGEVLSAKRVQLRNDQQQHLVLLVENDQGRRRIVDAGPVRQVRHLEIQQGDQVSVQGRIRRTKDQVPVLNAERIRASGRQVAIQRGQVSQRQSTTSR